VSLLVVIAVDRAHQLLFEATDELLHDFVHAADKLDIVGVKQRLLVYILSLHNT
jgi:hypothetical protein